MSRTLDQVLLNSGATPASPSTSGTLALSDLERPQFPTGTVTLTMPVAYPGWRTGTIKNNNTVTGLVTLAVPTGSTLDSITNGTTVLYPYQRARIVQITSGVYSTDWIDRSPILSSPNVPFVSAVASIDFAIPDGYRSFALIGTEVFPTINATILAWRCAYDGATIKTDANYGFATSGSGGNSSAGTPTYGYLSNGIATAAGMQPNIEAIINPGGVITSGKQIPVVISRAFYVNTDNGTYRFDDFGSTYGGQQGRINLFRLFATSGGNISGGFSLRGVP